LKIHLPYHEPGHVLNLACNVLTGGTPLDDIERLRRDVAYVNALGADLVPDPATAGDFWHRFTEADMVALMDAVNSVRTKLWRGPGPGPARAPWPASAWTGRSCPPRGHTSRAAWVAEPPI